MDTEHFNKHYAVVLAGSKALVMKFKADGDFQLLSKDAFITYVGKDAPLAREWLTSEKRRTYDGIVFEPDKDTPGYYNLWQGFSIQPKSGSCAKFLAHVRDNVCHGNESDCRYFMGWWASIFQRPSQKLETCICVVGAQGTGKSFVANAFKKLLGKYARTVSKSEHILGRFNGHLKSLLLLHAEEAFWADDKKSEGRIKDMITGKTQQIEGKFIDAIEIRNYMNLFVTSNEDRPVPADFESRRFAMWKISDAHKNDHEYFKAIGDELENGGYEALMDYLLKFDLSGINLREVPKTDALLTAKLAGLDDKHSWLLDILSNGRLPNDGVTNLDANECPTSMLFDAYIVHAKETSPRKKRSIQTSLGKWFADIIPDLTVKYVRVTTQYENGKQVKVYGFPSLSECRASFLKTLNQQVSAEFWGDEIEWGCIEPQPMKEKLRRWA
jgi:Family of unknown function (DUF5906)